MPDPALTPERLDELDRNSRRMLESTAVSAPYDITAAEVLALVAMARLAAPRAVPEAVCFWEVRFDTTICPKHGKPVVECPVKHVVGSFIAPEA